MIYYRSHQGSRNLSVGTVRLLSMVGLLAYPAGALVAGLGPNTLANSLAGYALIVIAFITFGALIGSSLQRIVAEDAKVLDEFELRLRGRALSASYAGFSALVLLAIMYAAFASDKGAWFPHSYVEFSGLFWGVFVYASLLPTAILSWMVDRNFIGD